VAHAQQLEIGEVTRAGGPRGMAVSGATKPGVLSPSSLNEHGQAVASTSAESCLYKPMPGLAGV